MNVFKVVEEGLAVDTNEGISEEKSYVKFHEVEGQIYLDIEVHGDDSEYEILLDSVYASMASIKEPHRFYLRSYPVSSTDALSFQLTRDDRRNYDFGYGDSLVHGLKPLVHETECTVTIANKLLTVEGRFYYVDEWFPFVIKWKFA